MDYNIVNNTNDNTNDNTNSNDLSEIRPEISSVLSSDNETSDDESNYGAIKILAYKSKVFGQIASTSFKDNDDFEPLPITDRSLYEESQDRNMLNINVNPFANWKVYFLPNVPIKVKVTGKRKSRRHLFNPYDYQIELTHGPYRWKINRDYSDLKEIHKDLGKTVMNDIGKSLSDISRNEIKPEWPLFPTTNDVFVHKSDLKDRCNQIEEYLDKLLKYPPFRDEKSVLEFLGVSHISFTNDIGQSYIEEFLKKRFYENVHAGNFKFLKRCCNENFRCFTEKRWFVLKDTYITYLRPENNYQIGYVMLIDRGFECKKVAKAGALNAVYIKNLQRTLVLRCKNSTQQERWFKRINAALSGAGHLFCNRENQSFAPSRSNQFCRWFINASGYMEAVMHGLNNAKEEIFITDWWMSPELFLKRPTDDLQYRLDKILLKKSKEGVKIYVLLFKEITMAVNLISARTQTILTQSGKNPNIKVLRHPRNSTPANFSLWSHHEKSVIIDQSIAFMGGIDLCYGRWDDDEHRLIDLGKTQNETELKTSSLVPELPILENNDSENNVSNSALALINTFATQVNATIVTSNQQQPECENRETEEKSETPTFKARRKSSLLKKKLISKKKKEMLNEGYENEEVLSDCSEIPDKPLIDNDYYWIGKDYSNAFKEDFKNLHDFSTDQLDRKGINRMPWRDEALVIIGESARDLARHFIQRWNHAKLELKRVDDDYPFLIPKSNSKLIKVKYDHLLINEMFKCNIQICRSLSAWSGGISETENSILKSYCKLIEKAEHFIYIENQFFVTAANKKDNLVNNTVAYALVERIKRAHEKQENFKIYVVLPLFPCFDSMNTILAVQYYNLRSITFGEYSIYNELNRAGINPSDYITFHGMRNWAVLMGKLVQECIYVHSKLMIVDDRYVICGSANINDRSLLGDRDSELAAVISDEEFVDSTLNNKTVKVGKYASSLRKKIFKLHLGIYYENPDKLSVNDCAVNEFFEYFKNVSEKNSILYEQCFKPLPSDSVQSLQDLVTYSNSPYLSRIDPVKAKAQMDQVKGLIVDFPLKFLSKEKNFFPSMTKEGMVPYETWT